MESGVDDRIKIYVCVAYIYTLYFPQIRVRFSCLGQTKYYLDKFIVGKNNHISTRSNIYCFFKK